MIGSHFNALVSLGVLAGGRAARIGGRDKGWMRYAGQSLIERTLGMLGDGFAARLVSANRDAARYQALGLRVMADRVVGYPGPLAGIDALLEQCDTPLLLTVPVDLRSIPRDLLQCLAAAGEGGAVAHDASGLQPLVSLWPVAQARELVTQALARCELAVHRVVEELALSVVRFDSADFGNLNTPEDFHE